MCLTVAEYYYLLNSISIQILWMLETVERRSVEHRRDGSDCEPYSLPITLTFNICLFYIVLIINNTWCKKFYTISTVIYIIFLSISPFAHITLYNYDKNVLRWLYVYFFKFLFLFVSVNECIFNIDILLLFTVTMTNYQSYISV